MYLYIYTYTYIYIYVPVYIHIYIYIYVYIYIHICTYIYIHIQYKLLVQLTHPRLLRTLKYVCIYTYLHVDQYKQIKKIYDLDPSCNAYRLHVSASHTHFAVAAACTCSAHTAAICTHERVMSHIAMSHVTRMNKA